MDNPLRALIFLRGAFNVLFAGYLLLQPMIVQRPADSGYYALGDGAIAVVLAFTLMREASGGRLFALTLCDARLNTAGPEAMDFVPGGNVLSHAVGAAKPWQGRHLRQALRGKPPTLACQWYWRFADAPLKPFSGVLLARRRLTLWVAAALGRVYART